MEIIKNYDLKKLSTIGIGPIIKEMKIIKSYDDINKIHKNTKILGNASNILFTENTYDLDFIKLAGIFNKYEIIDSENYLIKAGCGISISNLINDLAEKNIGGLEFLYGIPATLGGLIKNNGGAFGENIMDYVERIHTLKGVIEKDDIKYDYRFTNIRNIILFAELKLMKKHKNTIEKLIKKHLKTRKEKQPFNEKSLGSVFKNPSRDLFSGKIIEELGFKGICRNNICVSKKHANFIINKGHGNAKDFISIAEEIRGKAFLEKSIKLEYEIELFK